MNIKKISDEFFLRTIAERNLVLLKKTLNDAYGIILVKEMIEKGANINAFDEDG